MKNEKSLTVTKNGMLKKIRNFFAKVFKYDKKSDINDSEEIRAQGHEFVIQKNLTEKEEFTQKLHVDSREEIMNLANEINANEEVLATKTDEELDNIEEKLKKYLNNLKMQLKEEKIKNKIYEAKVNSLNNQNN